nr:uncharacterized protein LOC104646885 [Solanum lycopersicum]
MKRSIVESILCKETSKQIWDFMKKKYQGSARVKRAQLQALKRDFDTLHIKKGESVTSYYTRRMEISNEMRFHGEEMKDVKIVEKILRSLTPKITNRSSTSEEQALKAYTYISSNPRGKVRGRARGIGRGRGDQGNRDGVNEDGNRN